MRKLILYIEDDEAAQGVMEDVVRRVGSDVDVLFAGTARRGIEIYAQFSGLRERAIGLLIIDGELPDGKGWDVVQALLWIQKDLPPILAYVGDAGGDNGAIWKEAGAAAVLQKPADLAVLEDTIRRLLEPAPQTGS